jgi:hypothetical protein
VTNRSDVVAFLKALRRRDLAVSALTGSSVGLSAGTALGTLTGLVVGPSGMQENTIYTGVAGLIGGAIAGFIIAARKNTVADVEQRVPALKNVLLTAHELVTRSSHSSAQVTDLVFEHAANATRNLRPAIVFPSRHSLIALVVAVSTWVWVLTFAGSQDPQAPLTFGSPAPENVVGSIDVTISPPAYTRRDTINMSNPTRIEAIAGSRIALRVRGQDVRVETLDGEIRAAGDSSTFAFNAQADGFVAVRAGASARHLIGLTVTPDRNPHVRVTAPGKDMFLSDTSRVIPVNIEAADDLGLSTLKLRYTKVSGSGERFTFVEGEVPVTLERLSEREWRAKGTIDLSTLKLERGDMLVYRGAAADGRPGVALAESDAFLIEITQPGSLAAEGFAADDEQDKYALSQQMIILKTERLLARAGSLSPDSLTYYSQMLAAEQRSVRAEFVFMMGGEMAEEVVAGADIDESHHAEHDGEILAGRLVNRGRNALINAIRQMSRASAMLNEGKARDALPVEKAALNNLQEAFSRTRYLLRALTQRERLDLSRRLTGVLTLAGRDARPQPTVPIDPAITSLRRSLSSIALLASGNTPPGGKSAVAQAVLSVDPSDSTLQRVVSRLESNQFDEATLELASALRARLPREDATNEPFELRRLRGILNDLLRGRRLR